MISRSKQSASLVKRRNKYDEKSKHKLGIVNPDAAGIDVGSEVHYVCVPEERDEVTVKKFNCFTEDIYRLAD